MKINKFLGYFIVLILGSIITVAIDNYIGVDFKDIGGVAQCTHKITYMSWGGAILGMQKWLDS